jgi:hypothetical protein
MRSGMGLCAEIVIEIVEDVEDYRAFEAAVIADYDAETAIERELASPLWRLRRATAIETDLLRIQAGILQDRRDQTHQSEREQAISFRVIETGTPLRGSASDWKDDDPGRAYHQTTDSSRNLVDCFQRLAKLDNGLFERLGRYETALWRQMVQTVLLVQPINRR